MSRLASLFVLVALARGETSTQCDDGLPGEDGVSNDLLVLLQSRSVSGHAGRKSPPKCGNSSNYTVVQPQRMWNPMCIGIIGGVGPEASADVVNKTVFAASQQYWHMQARDTPYITLLSSPKLDGVTQNSWNHLDEGSQVSTIGEVLEELKNTFPPCVLDRGAFGLACNTIHQYLYEKTNISMQFVSLINAVNHTLRNKHNVKDGGEVYILGSELTMSNRGEYSALFREFKVNVGVTDTCFLWENVITQVQKGHVSNASDAFYKYLKKQNIPPHSIPISLSCTELPIAAFANPEKAKEYNFVDPNQALADMLLERSMQRLMDQAPEMYEEWMSGLRDFNDTCCEDPARKECNKCCYDKDCKNDAK